MCKATGTYNLIFQNLYKKQFFYYQDLKEGVKMTDRDNKKIDSRLANVVEQYKWPKIKSVDELSDGVRRIGANNTFRAMTELLGGFTWFPEDHYGLRIALGEYDSY